MADAPAKPGAQRQVPIPELRRQIGAERDALAKSMDKLAGEVGEAVDTARRQATEAGRKARSVAPAVGGAVVALLVARSVLRRRRRRRPQR